MPDVIELLESSRTKAGWLFLHRRFPRLYGFRLSGFSRVREEEKKDLFCQKKKMFSSGQKNEKCEWDTVFEKKYIYNNYITDFFINSISLNLA
jgi:hypothetical protein